MKKKLLFPALLLCLVSTQGISLAEAAPQTLFLTRNNTSILTGTVANDQFSPIATIPSAKTTPVAVGTVQGKNLLFVSNDKAVQAYEVGADGGINPLGGSQKIGRTIKNMTVGTVGNKAILFVATGRLARSPQITSYTISSDGNLNQVGDPFNSPIKISAMSAGAIDGKIVLFVAPPNKLIKDNLIHMYELQNNETLSLIQNLTDIANKEIKNDGMIFAEIDQHSLLFIVSPVCKSLFAGDVCIGSGKGSFIVQPYGIAADGTLTTPPRLNQIEINEAFGVGIAINKQQGTLYIASSLDAPAVLYEPHTVQAYDIDFTKGLVPKYEDTFTLPSSWFTVIE